MSRDCVLLFVICWRSWRVVDSLVVFCVLLLLFLCGWGFCVWGGGIMLLFLFCFERLFVFVLVLVLVLVFCWLFVFVGFLTII